MLSYLHDNLEGTVLTGIIYLLYSVELLRNLFN